jgi:hypothetical protein
MVSYDTVKGSEAMGSIREVDLRRLWIEKARTLDARGYFGKYSLERREEVLRKGYLGRYSPRECIGLARDQALKGRGLYTPNFLDNLRHYFGLIGEEMREELLRILDEIPPESYEPPRELHDPPGCPFVFQCRVLGCEVYFKIQILGTPQKPRVAFWSCHPPVRERR